MTLYSCIVSALSVSLAFAAADFENSAAAAPLAPRTWISTGPVLSPVATPRNPIVAVKDPTVVFHDGNWHVFATTADRNSTWSMAYFKFPTWDDAPAAQPFHLADNPNLSGYNCAPHVFYFRPHQKWYLVFQSQEPRFSTTTDISDPMSWSAPERFFAETPKSVVQGWLDYWIICDETHAYLFFPDDHGRFYRSRTRIDDFPRGFDEPVVILQEPNAADLFEGSCVYRIKGQDVYLCLVECVGADGSRYYRAWTSGRLDGAWTPLPEADSCDTPYAGPGNVITADGGPLWTMDISHGELLREEADERMIVDPQNLVLLYQGRVRTEEENYVLLLTVWRFSGRRGNEGPNESSRGNEKAPTRSLVRRFLGAGGRRSGIALSRSRRTATRGVHSHLGHCRRRREGHGDPRGAVAFHHGRRWKMERAA